MVEIVDLRGGVFHLHPVYDHHEQYYTVKVYLNPKREDGAPAEVYDGSEAGLKAIKGKQVFFFGFNSCVECLHFVERVRGYIESNFKKQDVAPLGFNKHNHIDVYTHERVDKIVYNMMEEYYHIDTSIGNINDIVNRWTTGIKRYNDTMHSMRDRRTDSDIIEHYKKSMSNQLHVFFTTTWNSYYDKFNVDECCMYHHIVSNMIDNTEIYIDDDRERMKRLLKCILLSIECISFNNMTPVIKNILMNMWNIDNYDIIDNKYISYTSNDIIRLVIDIQHKFDILDNESSNILIKNICIE